ncbi:Geminivirus AR1/BR1 coat protein [Corchorus capsularis]|uniref:Geminivirus AR1/BR1 coat protein n=1 Tax=Corchorus capsularis TaxID=210143 RepID=A0A1R3IEB1_COCAP|nr:Geminivirus AR1/BR1 coat protein [Corchorus capsularis]
MAIAQLSTQILRPIPAACGSFRSTSPSPPTAIFRTRKEAIPTKQKLKWALKLSLVEQSSPPKPTIDVEGLISFLNEDLPHLFDDQGIDRTAYDEQVKFRDPITKHDTISGYLFNISLLKVLFRPLFQLHWVKQTGPYEITTRWTMVMKFMILPWKPELVFTGTSVMGINPNNGKFNSHLDFWDSIKNNDYFSLEGLLDVFRQLRIYKTPDLETPEYQILKRTANYEVRKYAPFIVVETNGDKLSGSTGFNDVAGYIFGKNSATEKIPMTTPVFTQTLDPEMSDVSIQIVLPMDKDLGSLPVPSQETVKLRKVEGGIAAALKFSGKPTEEIVHEKEKELRSSLMRDGLKPKKGCMLARYNDPGRTWSFTMLPFICFVNMYSRKGIRYSNNTMTRAKYARPVGRRSFVYRRGPKVRVNQSAPKVQGAKMTRQRIHENQYGAQYALLNNTSSVSFITYPRLGGPEPNRSRAYIKLNRLRYKGTVNIECADPDVGMDPNRGGLSGVFTLAIVVDRKPHVGPTGSLPTFDDLFGCNLYSNGSLDITPQMKQRYYIRHVHKRVVSYEKDSIMMNISCSMGLSSPKYVCWSSFKDLDVDSCSGSYSNLAKNALLVYYCWVSNMPSKASSFVSFDLDYLG